MTGKPAEISHKRSRANRAGSGEEAAYFEHDAVRVEKDMSVTALHRHAFRCGSDRMAACATENSSASIVDFTMVDGGRFGTILSAWY